MPPDTEGPRLRIVRASEPQPPPCAGSSRIDEQVPSLSDSLIAGLKLNSIGAAIVRSLVEDGTRLTITIPKGVTDTEALIALHTLSKQRSGRDLFSFDTLHRIDLWGFEHRQPLSHRRTYSVELFVESTAGRDAFEAERTLKRVRIEPGMRLEPGDPVEVALLLAAHVLRYKGETPAQHREIRTRCDQITLTYFRLREEILITDRSPETRHDHVLTAGSPTPIPPRDGLFNAVRSAFGWMGKRGA